VLGLGATPALAATHDWARFGFDAARSNSSTASAGIAAAASSRFTRSQTPRTRSVSSCTRENAAYSTSCTTRPVSPSEIGVSLPRTHRAKCRISCGKP